MGKMSGIPKEIAFSGDGVLQNINIHQPVQAEYDACERNGLNSLNNKQQL